MFNNSENITQAWRELAYDLGFEYKEGEEGLRELFEKMSQLQMSSFSTAELDQIETTLNTPWVMALLGTIFPGAITGRHKDYEILISHTTSKRGDKHYPAVHIALFHPTPFELKFSVKNQDFLGGLVERIFRKRYIQLEDPELDPLVLVQGDDPHQIQLWLTARRMRDALLAMYQHDKRFEVNQQGLMWHSKDGRTIDRATAEATIDIMVNTADALNNISSW